ncbi:MAG: hypothetical protein KDN19_09485 [Verrucomicrobiae bacterium]|nr:hypothetical protein [Verrucomicrobiae bacterium]
MVKVSIFSVVSVAATTELRSLDRCQKDGGIELDSASRVFKMGWTLTAVELSHDPISDFLFTVSLSPDLLVQLRLGAANPVGRAHESGELAPQAGETTRTLG